MKKIIGSVALLVSLGMAYQATAQNPKASYSSMAPIEQYLMADQAAEIALARTAAPDSISRDADVMVLGRQGFTPRSKEKMASCASWRGVGLPQPIPTSGIRKCGFPCALTRQARILTLFA